MQRKIKNIENHDYLQKKINSFLIFLRDIINLQ